MKKTKNLKIFSIVLCLAFSFTSYANNLEGTIFNGLDPNTHVYKKYTNERRNELKNADISYDNIEDMVHLYNSTVLSNWNNWENNKSAQDIYQNYQDAADSLYNSASAQESELQEAMLKAQADAMRIQADKNADDSYTNFLNNYLAEMNIVYQTKENFINYFKSQVSVRSASATVEEQKRKADTANNALNYGNGTKVDTLTAKKNLADANSSLVLARSNETMYKRNVLINCGRSMNDNVSLVPITLSNQNVSFNLANDYSLALNNNIQYEIYKRKYNNAQTVEVKNEFDILVKSAPNKIYSDIETKYNNILDRKDSVRNQQIALDLANDSLAKAKNEYTNGNISKKAYSSAVYEVTLAECNLEIAKYDLEIAIESYKSAVAGLAKC